MRQRIEKIRRKVPVGIVLRVLAIVLTLALVCGGAVALVMAYRYVTVTDLNGAKTTLLTTSTSPEAILEQAGVEVGEHDEMKYVALNATTASITVRRAFPVHLEADGKVFTSYVLEGTVGDLLQASGVQLGEEDFIEPAADTPLASETKARVHRITYTEEQRREELEPEVVAAYLAERTDAAEDEEFHESRSNTYEVTYRDRLLDGRVESSQMVELVPIHVPIPIRDKNSYTIQNGVPCSRIEGYDDIEVDHNGIPLNYTRVDESMVCTAYSASRGRGASGLGLYCGTVAVNPNKIPYGSRMYITSADGNFIYGYAIATDTGIALMDGRVDIDLFFETNAECRQFGKRNLVVYFLAPEPEDAE